MKRSLTCLADVEGIKGMIEARKLDVNSYMTYTPLRRMRGHLQYVSRIRIAKTSCLLYLKPVEGALLMFKSDRKFPDQPTRIMYLSQI